MTGLGIHGADLTISWVAPAMFGAPVPGEFDVVFLKKAQVFGGRLHAEHSSFDGSNYQATSSN